MHANSALIANPSSAGSGWAGGNRGDPSGERVSWIASLSLSGGAHRKSLQRRRASPRAEGAGFYWRFDASAAICPAVPRAASVVGAGDGALRDRARRAGPGRLRSALGLGSARRRRRFIFPEVRKNLYTTNAIESLNAQVRNAVRMSRAIIRDADCSGLPKKRGLFDEAPLKPTPPGGVFGEPPTDISLFSDHQTCLNESTRKIGPASLPCHLKPGNKAAKQTL